MAGSFNFRWFVLLLAIAVSQVAAQINICNNCSFPYFFDTYLYVKYEEALIKDHYHLEELRAAFINSLPCVFVELSVGMSSVALTVKMMCWSMTYPLSVPHHIHGTFVETAIWI